MSVTVTNVMAVSLDGRIGKHKLESDYERHSYNFTNEDDKNWVREQLAKADAVITGANSLRASREAWEVLNDRGQYAAWIVLTKSGLAEDLPFWAQRKVRRVLVSTVSIQENHCQANGVEPLIVKSGNEAAATLAFLESQNLKRILLFGGGMINKMFYESNLVDFAKITLCPQIIGGLTSPNFVDPGLSHSVKMELISSVCKGSLVFLTYKIQK